MRARFLGCALAAVALLVPSHAAAVASPCEADASLCLAGGAPAACLSVGAIVSFADPQKRAVSEISASTADPQPYAKTTAEASLDPPAVPPVPRIHLGGIQSFCQAYMSGEAFGNHKACGRAGASEVFVDLNPVRIPLMVSVRGLFEEGCSSTGDDAGGYNLATFESATIVFDDLVRFVNAGGPANTIVPPSGGDLFVAFDERFTGVVEGCVVNQGSALRVVTPAATIQIGWVSTSACV